MTVTHLTICCSRIFSIGDSVYWSKISVSPAIPYLRKGNWRNTPMTGFTLQTRPGTIIPLHSLSSGLSVQLKVIIQAWLKKFERRNTITPTLYPKGLIIAVLHFLWGYLPFGVLVLVSQNSNNHPNENYPITTSL